ncbi:MAG: hypothetical protein BroJett040_19650 [Oligoflexia bacterium]|nr:MAG: hypothetical protein BroJett040_19650 [Oligoflexia bacterium]
MVAPSTLNHVRSEKVCAIVLTLNPDKKVVENIKSVLPQVGKVCIVDNGSEQKYFSKLDEFSTSQFKDRVIIFRNKFNLGVATGFNIGSRYARQNGFEWVLLVDQDTRPEPNFVQALLNGYETHPEKEKIGQLVPVPYVPATNEIPRHFKNKTKPFVIDVAISSGSLIKLDVLHQLNYFDDTLFVDYVDIDFCLRLRKNNLWTIACMDAKIAHEEGQLRQIICLNLFSFYTHNYNHIRRYYKMRNMIIMYRRYVGVFPGWVLKDLRFVIKDFLKVLFFESDRRQKMIYMIKGLFDSIVWRQGCISGATYLTPKPIFYYNEVRRDDFPLLPKKIENILDVGCGAGVTSGLLLKQGAAKRAVGIEYFQEEADQAAKVLSKVYVRDLNLPKLEIDEDPFDVVLVLDVLEHLVDPWTAAASIANYVKPGGSVIVSVPNVKHYSVFFPLLFTNDWLYQEGGVLDATHLRFFTEKTIKKLLEGCGLKVDRIYYVGEEPLSKKWFFNLLTFNLFRNLLRYQILIRAKKESSV